MKPRLIAYNEEIAIIVSRDGVMKFGVVVSDNPDNGTREFETRYRR